MWGRRASRGVRRLSAVIPVWSYKFEARAMKKMSGKESERVEGVSRREEVKDRGWRESE